MTDASSGNPPPPTFAGDIWTRKQAFGDPFGLRSELAEHGITLDLRLSQFHQHVTSGGPPQRRAGSALRGLSSRQRS